MAQSSESSKKKALVLVVDNCNDVEVANTTYCLRLAGVETILAGVEGTDLVVCNRGLKFVPDMSLEEAVKRGPYDVIVLPGGRVGGDSLAKSKLVGEVLREQEKCGRLVAAICCGAGFAVTGHGIYKGKRLTTYPADEIYQRVIENNTHVLVRDEAVVVDGLLITAQGPATSFPFALRIIRELCGTETEQTARKFILLDTVT